MSKAGLKSLIAVSLLFAGLVSWQLANQYEFSYMLNETPEAMKAYSSAMSLTIAFMTLSCVTFIWSAVAAYFRE
jgi:hypothetical protein